MTTLILLILGSVSMVLAAEHITATRTVMQKITRIYTPGTCRSFILDILILLPLIGLLVEAIARRVKSLRLSATLPFVISIFFLSTAHLFQDYYSEAEPCYGGRCAKHRYIIPRF